jgi:hypothetical protein
MWRIWVTFIVNLKIHTEFFYKIQFLCLSVSCAIQSRSLRQATAIYQSDSAERVVFVMTVALNFSLLFGLPDCNRVCMPHLFSAYYMSCPSNQF